MKWLGKKQQVYALSIPERYCTVPVAPGGTLLDAALDNGIDFPNLCRVGSCGTCRCRLTQGRIKPLIDFSYVLSSEEIDSGYILACQSVALSDCEVFLSDQDKPEAIPDAAGLRAALSGEQG